MSASVSAKESAEDSETDGEYERREFEVLARLDLQGLMVLVGDLLEFLAADATGHGLSYNSLWSSSAIIVEEKDESN